jgi:uracil-DNA glycosylase family protein
MEMDLTLDLWGVENPEEELEKVRQQALTCTACRLAETRTNVVFGEGNPRAPLVFVGEGPGEHEDATGRPFVGRAGALLDQALRENGLSRKHVYICNVIKCRASIVENGRVRNRPPYADEIAACHKWLDLQLTIIQPLVIVCLGAPAANTLIHKNFKMTQERGIWFPCHYARYAMATLHPAYILRQEGESYQQNYRLLVQDIAAARQKVIEAKKEPKTTLF